MVLLIIWAKVHEDFAEIAPPTSPALLPVITLLAIFAAMHPLSDFTNIPPPELLDVLSLMKFFIMSADPVEYISIPPPPKSPAVFPSIVFSEIKPVPHPPTALSRTITRDSVAYDNDGATYTNSGSEARTIASNYVISDGR